MSGRFQNETQQEQSGPQPAVVLVRPQMGENIGSAARAMWNFGLFRMRLVQPRDGWPNPRAVATSSGAGRVLDNLTVHDATADAVADCGFVYATTARARGLTKDILTPEEAMRDAHARIGRGQQVAILFGPERSGLENDDIARANAVISVPVNPAFASLNLGQCVLLTAYEWRRQQQDIPQETPPGMLAEPAQAIEIEKLHDHFTQRLDAVNFFFPEAKAPGMRLNLRNMLSRMPLTRADVQTFHGILRALTRRHDRG